MPWCISSAAGHHQENVEDGVVNCAVDGGKQPAEHAAEAHEQQDDARNLDHLVIELELALEQGVVQQMVAVKRRDGQEVKDSEGQVDLAHHHQEALDVLKPRHAEVFAVICGIERAVHDLIGNHING